MNLLQIGFADKTLDPGKPGFLLIDDGPIAETFLKQYDRATAFSPFTHSFNPLPMSFQGAWDFATVLYDGKGETTLAARDGMVALTWKLMHGRSIDKLPVSPYGPRGEEDATAVINGLLLSPLMRDVLTKPTNFSFRKHSSTVARLNRAELGRDARILGALLIMQAKDQVIVPDFGYYARPFHDLLVLDNRLMAGVYTLSELEPKLRNRCLLMEKEGRGCTYEDAAVLARYAGYIPNTVGFHDFIETAMSFPQPSRANI